MVARVLIIASAACVFNLAHGISAPFPGFKPCRNDDDACILQNAKDGLPSFVDGLPALGIKSSDPDHYDRVDASTPNLKFILTDVILTGMKSCKPLKIKRDEANLKMVLVLQCKLKLDANYELNGKVLFVDMKGNDKLHVELPNIISTITCNYIYKDGKDGKKHIRIKNFVHSYELKEKSTVVFEGLFKDNEVLRQATNEVIKNNPDEIIQEIGHKIFEAVIKKEVGNVNKFFGAYSYDELALN